MGIQHEWLAAVDGQPINPDGFAENQCVDVVDHYGEFIFGVPWPICVGGVMGAKDLLGVAPGKYWEKIPYTPGFRPQFGDVGVMGGSALNQWGHTFFTLGSDGGGIDVLQQDGFAPPLRNGYSIKPAHRARLAYSSPGTGPLIGVLRPRPELMRTGTTPAGNITQEEQDIMASIEDLRAVVREEIRTAFKFSTKDGVSGQNERGGLADMADDVREIKQTLTPGIGGVRNAGEAIAAIDEIVKNDGN